MPLLAIQRIGVAGTPAPNVPNPIADVLPPTRPAYPIGTPGPLTGQITWTVEQSVDQHDGVTAAVGLDPTAGYDYRINGGAPVSIARLAANIQGQPTALRNIGTMSPSPSFSQNGNEWTLTAAGTGLEGTAVQIAFLERGTPNGNFTISLEGISHTVAASGADREYGQRGLIVMNSLTAATEFVSVGQMAGLPPFGGSIAGVQVKSRSVNGAAVTNGASLVGNNTVKSLWLRRIGTTVEVGCTDNAGVWTTLASLSASFLSSTVYVGEFLYSQSASVTASAVHTTPALTNGTRVSFLQSGASGAQSIEWRARDLNGVVSPWTTALAATPLAASSGKRKFVPGQGAWLDTLKTSPATRTDHFSKIDSLVSSPNVKFVLVGFFWGDLELGHGDFSGANRGFDLIQQYLDRCAAVSTARGSLLMLHIRVYDRIFGGISPSNLNNGYYFPLYLKSGPYEGYYTLANGGGGLNTVVKLWESNNMTAFIECGQAFATHFDTHPNFQMWGMEETVVNFNNNQADITAATYTDAKYVAQWKRWISAMGPAWFTSAVRFQLNYFLQAYTECGDLLQLCKEKEVSVGGPDTIPIGVANGDDWGDLAYIGTINGHKYFGDTGQQPEVGRVCETQDYGLGHFTLANIHAKTVYFKAHWECWYWNNFSAKTWSGDILPFINSVAGVAGSITYPTAWRQ